MFEIGTKFIRYNNKRKDIETITDILTTTNSKGEIVEVRYVVEHEFLGQIITDRVTGTTIARSKIVEQTLN